jgi:hypothetical protein
MHLPRHVYELLPYAYAGGGLVLCAASYAGRSTVWSDPALALGAAGLLGGLVLILRRRSYRDDAARYDRHSLDD